jgi:cytochrome c-type biogenesis protein
VPGFLVYLAGSSVTGTPSRRATFTNALCFVLGFSVVFAVLGVLLQTALSSVAYDARIWLSRAGGVIVIAFGLYLAKVIRIPFLDREHKFGVAASPGRSRYLTSALFGAAFAAGWTPCVGAVLGAILTLAVTSPGSSFALLMAYSLGLGLPFLLVGLFAAGAQGIINRYARAMSYVSVVFGILLVVLGILVFTQRLERLANFEFLNRIILTQ